MSADNPSAQHDRPRRDEHLEAARALTAVSALSVLGLVIAVSTRQQPLVAVPLGLLAACTYLGARHKLARRPTATASPRTTAASPISDRAFAIAYPLVTIGVLAGLFAAYLAIHEANWTIEESTVHAAYWAVFGTMWLAPVAAEAWQRPGPR